MGDSGKLEIASGTGVMAVQSSCLHFFIDFETRRGTTYLEGGYIQGSVTNVKNIYFGNLENFQSSEQTSIFVETRGDENVKIFNGD